MADYPEYCIRGVKEKKNINDDDTVGFPVYLPDTRTATSRSDSGFETSINWEDDDGVLEFTLEFRDDNNQLAFPNGAIRLPKSEIDHVNVMASTENTLSYQRSALPKNLYHGDIVFRGDLAPAKRNMIASILAAASSKVFRLDQFR